MHLAQHRKLKIDEQHGPYKKIRVKLGARKGK
jgi:hypothetical protein